VAGAQAPTATANKIKIAVFMMPSVLLESNTGTSLQHPRECCKIQTVLRYSLGGDHMDAHLDVAALYAALDQQRRTKSLSWRQLAQKAGVSPSTLTRMSQGKRPDVDSFAALIRWLGISADRFVRGASREAKAQPGLMAEISTFLRARRELSPESAQALEEIMRAAYDRLKKGP